MEEKWFGAIMIIAGCGGFGAVLVSHYKMTEQGLRQLLRVIEYMNSDLQYRLTPLPELCCQAANLGSGALKDIFYNLSRELEWRTEPDAAGCMRVALDRSKAISKTLRKLLLDLGKSLGRFDLSGQLQGLQEIHGRCEYEISLFEKNREVRLRNYRTLTLCAGAALAILFA